MILNAATWIPALTTAAAASVESSEVGIGAPVLFLMMTAFSLLMFSGHHLFKKIDEIRLRKKEYGLINFHHISQVCLMLFWISLVMLCISILFLPAMLI